MSRIFSSNFSLSTKDCLLYVDSGDIQRKDKDGDSKNHLYEIIYYLPALDHPIPPM